MLCIAGRLLLFRLERQTNSSTAEYDFLQYMERELALREADEQLRYMCLKQSNVDNEGYHAVESE